MDRNRRNSNTIQSRHGDREGILYPVPNKLKHAPGARPRRTRIRIDVFPAVLDRRRGQIVVGGRRFPCALGAGGPGHRKVEGDGRTPFGPLAILGGRYRADKGPHPRNRIGLRPSRPSDGWCDEVTDGRYNRPVRLPVRVRHERMYRQDHLYDVVLILDWNIRPRKRGCGSAIFLHLAHPDFRPTEGCIAVARPVMGMILALCRRGTIVRVARG